MSIMSESRFTFQSFSGGPAEAGQLTFIVRVGICTNFKTVNYYNVFRGLDVKLYECLGIILIKCRICPDNIILLITMERCGHITNYKSIL